MAKRVTFIPRHAAESMPVEPDTLLISITHPGDLADVDDWSPYLTCVYFDDIEFQSGGYVMFDTIMADHLIEAVQMAGDADVIVHCEAGMSRSAAVAKWLSDRMGYQLWLHPDGIGTAKHYNRHVYKTLDAASGRDMAAYYAELEKNDRMML